MLSSLFQNRRKLARLIYSQPARFTYTDLMTTFEQENSGGAVIDGQETISEYLSMLSQIGVLEHKDNYYQVHR